MLKGPGRELIFQNPGNIVTPKICLLNDYKPPSVTLVNSLHAAMYNKNGNSSEITVEPKDGMLTFDQKIEAPALMQ